MTAAATNPDLDRAAIARKAMSTFWQQGAEATSYDGIVAATGLSRKALYALWPDKQALIHEAMALYRAEVLAPLLALLGRPGREGLEAFWDALARGTKIGGWSGCFLFRSSAGQLRGDPIIAEHFDDHVRLLRSGVARALREAKAEGTIDPDVEITDAGWQVVAIVSLISSYGALHGNTSAVPALITAGRAACGLASKGTRTRA
jgi:TetR/AcrR family transcriptional regulator, transcriptional repressor for nem operon